MIAAMRLFRFSGLIHWDAGSARFTEESQSTFDSSWPKIDPVCGRLICWISFSAAAEFFAKGICLLRNVEVRKQHNGKVKFGTFGDLQEALKRLSDVVDLEEKQRQMILQVYERLRSEIRNRDAHAYIPNVRASHFDFVRDECVPCLNLLISCLPISPQEINKWSDEAPQFIASLQ